MHVVVCLKYILDPEIPPKAFAIDETAKTPERGNHQYVIGPFDENALEVALQLQESSDDITVTALTFGGEDAEEALRKALSVKADEAVLVEREGADDLGSYVTAEVLAAAIEELDESPDLVLCGRQGGDWDMGQVGYLLAERLGMSTVSFITSVEKEDGRLRFERNAEEGVEVVAADGPVMATVTNAEENVLRLAKVMDIMQANRKDLTRWTPADLGVEVDAFTGDGARVQIKELYIPEGESECEFIEGDDGAEMADNLAQRLRESKII